jgi:hypothetical protein
MDRSTRVRGVRVSKENDVLDVVRKTWFEV